VKITGVGPGIYRRASSGHDRPELQHANDADDPSRPV
jgi:hypothetical protein